VIAAGLLLSAVQVITWPADVSSITTDEVTRLLGKALAVEHCRRDCVGSSVRVVISDSTPKDVRKEAERRRVFASANRATRIVYVFADYVQAETRMPRRPEYHVAIGRIAAHEIVHVLVQHKDHWGDGLMRGHADARYLLGPLPPLAEAEVR
jgi:hypothetical protein